MVQTTQPPLLSAERFIYWLQGYFEIADPKILTTKEIEMIKKHLDMCFEHRFTYIHDNLPTPNDPVPFPAVPFPIPNIDPWTNQPITIC